jgi:hypothetical protein
MSTAHGASSLLRHATLHRLTRHRANAAALRAAADEWQQRRGFERVLTMGFLSGTQPIVDLYELKVGGGRGHSCRCGCASSCFGSWVGGY